MKYTTILRNAFVVIISVLIVAAVVKAGDLNPVAVPAATFYTLENIWTRLTNNAAGPVLEGSHNLGPAALPVGTMHTVKQIYEIIPPIDGSKILQGTSYLGTAGTIATQTLSADNDTVNVGYYAATTLHGVDADLAEGNIKKDTAIFGITGTLAPAGTAAATDCLLNTTFYSGNSWIQKIGSIATCAADNGGTCYVSNASKSLLDANLATGNIRSTVSIFGIAGDANVVNTSSGDAVLTDILTGKKCWVDGLEVTGNVTAGDDVPGGEGLISFSIPNGLYSGKSCTAVDGDIAAGNIKSGVTILGQLGTYTGAKALLPTTFQVLCYDTDGGDPIDCGGVDWPSQDADAIGNSGACTPTYTESDNTVTDSCTNLEWQRHGHASDDGVTAPAAAGDCDLNGGAYVAGVPATCKYTWRNALKYCYNLNSLNAGAGFDNKTGWRLPNAKELQSIVKYSAFSPAIDTTKFSNTKSNSYWSSTTGASGTNDAWVAGFYLGLVDSYAKTNSYYVRCVRQY